MRLCALASRKLFDDFRHAGLCHKEMLAVSDIGPLTCFALVCGCAIEERKLLRRIKHNIKIFYLNIQNNYFIYCTQLITSKQTIS